MLNHLYGGSLRRPDGNTVANGDFILFSQSEFFNFAPSLSSMDTAGYVRVHILYLHHYTLKRVLL